LLYVYRKLLYAITVIFFISDKGIEELKDEFLLLFYDA
jgi:hypothetical protein